MYHKILIAILILLAALEIIAGILHSPRLAKACMIGVVLLIATALILWVVLGLSPIPPWFMKLIHRLYSTAASGVSAVTK